MQTKWESLVELAHKVDEECATGLAPDFTRVSLLARAVLEFHAQLSPGVVSSRRRGEVARGAEPPKIARIG